MPLRRPCWRLQALAAEALLRLLALLPLGLLRSLGRAAGLALSLLWRGRYRVALEGISQAMARGALEVQGSASALARASFMHLGESLAELLKLQYCASGELLQSISIRGQEHYRAAKRRGRGVIFLTAHLGNWELLALWAGRHLGGLTVVARPLKNPYLERLLQGLRARWGNRVLSKFGALRPLVSLLRGGATVGLLVDQAVLPSEGLLVEFLGRPAWSSRVPLLLARRTGAALLPAFIRRTDKGHVITIRPEIPLQGSEQEVLRRINQSIEEAIREAPQQWLWIHRRWKRLSP
jgi:KDO2-lipid IV(A) lauroyltransferase